MKNIISIIFEILKRFVYIPLVILSVSVTLILLVFAGITGILALISILIINVIGLSVEYLFDELQKPIIKND